MDKKLRFKSLFSMDFEILLTLIFVIFSNPKHKHFLQIIPLKQYQNNTFKTISKYDIMITYLNDDY